MADEKEKDLKKDEETQGKKDEEKQDEETKEEDAQAKTEEKTDEKKDEETQASGPEMVNALKGIMGLVNKLMQMVGGGDESAMRTEKNQTADILMAQAQFMMDELAAGRFPDAEAVEKAGKRVTPARLGKLEKFAEELQSFIADLKGGEAKEETQSKDEDDGKAKTEKSATSEDKLDKLLEKFEGVEKRLDKIEAGGGASRGESEDESGGGKEKTEKSNEGDMSGFFAGIGGIQ